MEFASRAEAVTFLQNDPDGYFRKLTDVDLFARGARTRNEYVNNAVKAIVDPSVIPPEQLERVRIMHRRAVDYLASEGIKAPPIKLVFMNGVAYENGLPHTRKNYVFVQTGAIARANASLGALLAHEIVHVWQRYNPKRTRELLGRAGYRPVGKLRDFNGNGLLRSNPDIDDNVYIDTYGSPMIELYTSNMPNGIADAVGRHPYEIMAYELEGDAVFGLVTTLG